MTLATARNVRLWFAGGVLGDLAPRCQRRRELRLRAGDRRSIGSCQGLDTAGRV